MNDYWDYLAHATDGGERKNHKYYTRIPDGKYVSGHTKYRYFYSRTEYEAYMRNKRRGDSARAMKLQKEHGGNGYKVTEVPNGYKLTPGRWKVVTDPQDKDYRLLRTTYHDTGVTDYTVTEKNIDTGETREKWVPYSKGEEELVRMARKKGLIPKSKRKKNPVKSAKRMYHKASVTTKKGMLTVKRLLEQRSMK